MRRAALLLAMLLCALPAFAQDDDPVRRARQLILEDRLDEAEESLDRARRGDDAEVELLRGLIDLGRQDFAAAAVRFERTLEMRPDRRAVWLYLAQARAADGDAPGAYGALLAGESVGVELPGYFVLRAQTEQSLERTDAAWATLERGHERFPGETTLLRERALLRLNLGLPGAAAEAGNVYRDVAPEEAYAWLLVGAAFREAGRAEEAIVVLEEARLRFPREIDIAVQLAYVYASEGRHRSAAGLFDRLASAGHPYAFEAADQYRLAGRGRSALRWNARVPDTARKLPQRVAILVADERYDAALALLGPLDDAGLVDDPMAYHLGYSAVQVGRYDLAETLTARIITSDHAALARSLEEAIENCRTRGCY